MSFIKTVGFEWTAADVNGIQPPRVEQCAGWTRNRRRCWNLAVKGTDYCYIHSEGPKKEPDEIKAAVRKWNKFFNG